MANSQNNKNAKQNNPQITSTDKTGIDSGKNKAAGLKREADEKGLRNNGKRSKSS